MLIRPEQPSDFAAIRDLVKTAFATAKVSNGDEQGFLDRLRASDGYIPQLAMVAEDDSGLVGQITLTQTSITTANGPRPLLLLGPICVVLERRRSGLGSRLIGEALDRARQLGHAAVILVGNPAYYGRFGFRPAIAFGVANANGIPDQYVMALELVAGGLANAAGSITFAT